MSFELHSWQKSACNKAWAGMMNGQRVLLVAPTGSGKTVMGSTIARHYSEKGMGTVLWLAHRVELVAQAADKLRALGLRVGIIAGSLPMDPLAPVQVASIQTLTARKDLQWVQGLVIVDEAHHAAAETWREVINRFGSHCLGLTATPFRLDGKGLGGGLFDMITAAATPRNLVERGYLVEPIVYAPSIPDLSGVKKARGDYVTKLTSALMGERKLVGDIVEHWERLSLGDTAEFSAAMGLAQTTTGRRTVVFCVDIAHADLVDEAFRKAGHSSRVVSSKTPPQERRDTLAQLERGQIDVVCNCQILTEGYDLPQLTCVVLARPTASLQLHLQMVGRVMRTSPGKSAAIILDHAGNHLRHGRATDQRTYTLDDTNPVATLSDGLKRCPECFAIMDLGPAECAECGECFAVSDAGVVYSGPQTTDERLQKYTGDAEFLAQAAAWETLMADAEPNSRRRFKDRFGVWPLVHAGQLVDPTRADRKVKEAVYRGLAAQAVLKGFAEGWASHQYRETFGVWPTSLKHIYKELKREKPPCNVRDDTRHPARRAARLDRGHDHQRSQGKIPG